MKECFKCKVSKPLSEFYKHAQMADGHLNKCKECTKKDVGKHREENLERVQAYDRSRSNLPHRVEARAEYQKTEAFAKSHAKSLKKHAEKYPERAKARIATGNAIRDGRLIPWPVCAIPECSNKPEAHHPDYSRALDVVWLCTKHHTDAHNLGRELKRTSK